MIRGLFIIIVLLAILVRTVGAAQAGVLGWTWLTLMKPQELIWGFAADLPLNLVMAIITVIAWMVSREPKRLEINAAVIIWFAFIVVITVTTFWSLAPELAWPQWILTIKIMLLGFMAAIIMTTRVRIHALVWVAALSLGYFGIKGGFFTLIHGGRFQVLPVAAFGDNNNLALVMCMILPLMNYLRLQSAHRYIRLGTIAAMALTALAVLGTYSRGGLIGLCIMGVYLWWHSTSRIVIALVGLVVAASAYNFMPPNWIDRMGTIQIATEDTSFRDRLAAWRTALNIAEARPLTGGGFNATESPAVYQKYGTDVSGRPDPSGRPRAAHSIFFEVLGDHGFLGFGLYLALLLVTWRFAGAIRRKARRDPKLEWIADLTAMIQVSLATFVVAGAALSMAYYDMFYLLLGLTLALRKIVQQPQVQVHAEVQSRFPELARPAG